MVALVLFSKQPQYFPSLALLTTPLQVCWEGKVGSVQTHPSHRFASVEVKWRYISSSGVGRPLFKSPGAIECNDSLLEFDQFPRRSRTRSLHSMRRLGFQTVPSAFASRFQSVYGKRKSRSELRLQRSPRASGNILYPSAVYLYLFIQTVNAFVHPELTPNLTPRPPASLSQGTRSSIRWKTVLISCLLSSHGASR